MGWDPTGDDDIACLDFKPMTQTDPLSGLDRTALPVPPSPLPELPGKGSSYAAYGAFAASTTGMVALAIPGTEWAAPPLFGIANFLGTGSAVLGTTQAIVHSAQFVGGDAAAGKMIPGDLWNVGSSVIAGGMGKGFVGFEQSFTPFQNQLFQQWGITGAQALQAGAADGQDIFVPHEFTRNTSFFYSPDASFSMPSTRRK
jgi:hypothetical protein